MANIRSANITLEVAANNGGTARVNFTVHGNADGLHDVLFAALEQAWREHRAEQTRLTGEPEQLGFDFG